MRAPTPTMVLALTVAIAAILGRPAAAATDGGPSGRSVQAIMDGWVDPSADRLWGAVGVIETASGLHLRAPHGEAQWKRLRATAERLIAGAEALGRARSVGGEGHGALADASTPGIRTATQIKGDVEADSVRFRAAARRLELAARDAATAIDARNPGALTVAGARMDAACEGCHAAYWYPRTPPAPLPSDEDFARMSTAP